MVMFAVIVIAALAIDAATWYQKHHNAQVAADSAALAAANYMSSGGTASVATSTATTYAGSNGISIPSADVTIDPTKETVTVTVPTTGALTFAGIDLGMNPTITARAVATWNQTDCAVSGTHCAFMFAADPVCTSNTGVTGTLRNGTGTIQHGVTVAKNGSSGGVNGGVISASNITTDVNGNQTWQSTAAYSNASNCSGPSPSSPSPFLAAYTRPILSSWPIDYSKIYPACNPTGTSTLFGSVSCDTNNFPNYCTPSQESTAATDTISASAPSNAIICDAGSGTHSNPATWNGTIVQSNGGATDTYIAGVVDFSLPSNTTLSPASGNDLLAYAADCNASTPAPTTCNSSSTTSPAVDITSNGNATVTGDVFAPAGVIDSHLGGNPTMTAFLEGWDVVYNVDGNVYGEGPTISSADQVFSDYLTQ